MARQALIFSTLQPGAIEPSALAYEPIPIAPPGPPVIDPDRPERFGKPNYDSKRIYSVINAALESAFGDVTLVVTVASPGTESIETQTFVYHGTDAVTPVRFVDGTGDYERWLDIFAKPFGEGPVQFGFSRSSHSASRAIHLDLLATDPASWISRQAPSSWVARSQSQAKESILEAARQVAGPPTVTDPDLIASLWSELVETAGLTANPGATALEIETFRQATGFDLPEGLAALLASSNGAADAFGFRSLMSVAEIARQWAEWKQIFDDFLLDDLQHPYQTDQDRTLAMYTTPLWVPFADERTGNYAAVDLLPGPAGQQGQVIYFGADQDTIRWVAADIADFLKREITSVQAGRKNWF